MQAVLGLCVGVQFTRVQGASFSVMVHIIMSVSVLGCQGSY